MKKLSFKLKFISFRSGRKEYDIVLRKNDSYLGYFTKHNRRYRQKYSAGLEPKNFYSDYEHHSSNNIKEITETISHDAEHYLMEHNIVGVLSDKIKDLEQRIEKLEHFKQNIGYYIGDTNK